MLATFQVLNNPMWQVTTILGSENTEHFQHLTEQPGPKAPHRARTPWHTQHLSSPGTGPVTKDKTNKRNGRKGDFVFAQPISHFNQIQMFLLPTPTNIRPVKTFQNVNHEWGKICLGLPRYNSYESKSRSSKLWRQKAMASF